MKRRLLVITVVFLFGVLEVAAQVFSLDTATVGRIRNEGINRSQVMGLLRNLTDVHGPRLTGSPEYKEGADWARSTLASWGLANARLEEWGPFGRGWTLKHFSAQMTEPRVMPLIAFPKAWSPGTKGTLKAEALYLDVSKEEDLAKFKGKLKGKIVLISEPRELQAHFKPEAERLSDADLLAKANAGMPAPQAGMRMANFRELPRPQRDSALYVMFRQFMPDADSLEVVQRVAAFRLAPLKLTFVHDEGALAILDAGRGDGGTVFLGGAEVPEGERQAPGKRLTPYAEDAPKILPQVTVSSEHYNRMVRLLQNGVKVMVEMKLDVAWTDVQPGLNVLAEIPGTDLKDEVVMLGGHFDTWHAGTGATDNSTGSAAAMEAVRILKTLGLQPRRTVRIALWGGEEQGLIGSREYVASTFAERGQDGQIAIKDGFDRFSVYFNHDNGSGRIRGVYLQGNETARPVFRAWLEPFAETGASTLTLSNTGGTDHLSFDAVGLPGFQFIQDPIEYGSRTHHSNMDVYDRVQEEDMKQAATIMATFVYSAAMMDQRFPRKPMPVPTAPAPAQ